MGICHQRSNWLDPLETYRFHNYSNSHIGHCSIRLLLFPWFFEIICNKYFVRPLLIFFFVIREDNVFGFGNIIYICRGVIYYDFPSCPRNTNNSRIILSWGAMQLHKPHKTVFSKFICTKDQSILKICNCC